MSQQTDSWFAGTAFGGGSIRPEDVGLAFVRRISTLSNLFSTDAAVYRTLIVWWKTNRCRAARVGKPLP
jgi:hypothetical protein